jgi:hypothetical protein
MSRKSRPFGTVKSDKTETSQQKMNENFHSDNTTKPEGGEGEEAGMVKEE